jgi:hypothetical protein
MINIDKSNFVGKGNHRVCYVHPENENLCIKIALVKESIETLREQKYYKHLQNRNISWDMIPEFHGDIDTNLGIGSVFDLVLDYTGQVSKTLEYYLSTNEITQEHYEGLSISLKLLRVYLLENRIISTELRPENIVCKIMKSGDYRLILVDNIGNSELIPISNYSKYFAKKKILRKWKRFEETILDIYSNNSVLARLLTP